MKDSERNIAKKALAALTRLRQGCNPFDLEALGRFSRDSEEFPKYCEELGIPTDYGVGTLDLLQRISRRGSGSGREYKTGGKMNGRKTLYT